MRAKRFLASVLSFALCAGASPVVSAHAGLSADNAAVGAADGIITDEHSKISGISDIENKSKTAVMRTYNTVGASVVTIKLGDINGDDVINSVDASAILAAYASLSGSNRNSGLTAAQTIAARAVMAKRRSTQGPCPAAAPPGSPPAARYTPPWSERGPGPPARERRDRSPPARAGAGA